jgi:hypothetical protein
MAKAIDGTQTPPHGLFYMENAGGSKVEPETPASPRQTSISQAVSL